METQLHVVKIYSQDIGMEFGIEKYAKIVMKSGNDTRRTEWKYWIKINLERSEKKTTFKYFGILEADTSGYERKN